MNNSLYDKFAASFAAEHLSSLVESFNSQVGCRGWGSARACHDQALIAELAKRGIDLSAVSDGNAMSFAHHVRLDGKRLVTTD